MANKKIISSQTLFFGAAGSRRSTQQHTKPNTNTSAGGFKLPGCILDKRYKSRRNPTIEIIEIGISDCKNGLEAAQY
jgi:hypothetical protein